MMVTIWQIALVLPDKWHMMVHIEVMWVLLDRLVEEVGRFARGQISLAASCRILTLRTG